ncbi:YesL family protein [Nonomuraea sp. NPDC050663]|uniref:YesL family protein n=1 Tax=Nonomuraea sp. NPDC050663 TaxID=3364370 RepID=UPI0037B55415
MLKLYRAFDEVFWTARLNLLWLAFTLMGGIVLGIGPATVAAYGLARRHSQGKSTTVGDFAGLFRKEFRSGSVLVLPIVAVVTLLIGYYEYFTGPMRTLTGVGLILVAATASYLLPMYVHYDLRPRAYVPTASLFALTRPAATILLLFILTAVVFATASLPLLAPLFTVGAWIHLNTWLCLRFFAENEARLLAKGI